MSKIITPEKQSWATPTRSDKRGFLAYASGWRADLPCRSNSVAMLLFLALAVTAEPAAARLDLYPPDIQLRTASARQQIVVVATRGDGVTEDVTAKAKITVADGRIARVENATIYPTADGRTTLQAQYDGQAASTSLAVQDMAIVPQVSFRRDVMPVFMRAGCNTGGCHGSARGKDGFRLSLFGFDPEGDYFRLTRELGYRRVNLALPEESLVLQKALGAVPHTGGKRFEPSSEYAKTLTIWLQAGAPNDPPTVPTVESVEIFPHEMLLEGAGAKQQMIARAPYSDGSQRDVTDACAFLQQQRQFRAGLARRRGHRRPIGAKPSFWHASIPRPLAARRSCFLPG